MQAICRVARIGQKKEVHAVRLLAEDTVDSRMFKMQQQKIKQVSSALEKFQEDKSFGFRALRIVAGLRFMRKGDEDEEGRFNDQEGIDEDEQFYSAEEGGPDGENDDEDDDED